MSFNPVCKLLRDTYYCAMKTENPSPSPVAPKSSSDTPKDSANVSALQTSSASPMTQFVALIAYGLGFTLFMPLILPIAWPYLHPGVRAIWVLLIVGLTWHQYQYVGEKAEGLGGIPYPALLVWVLGPLIVISVRALDRRLFPRT